MQGDVGWQNVFGGTPGAITNEGTYRKSAGTGISTIPTIIPLINTGTVDVQSGTLRIDALDHQAGALITGNGTIDLPASYTFNGDINAGPVGGVGTLTFIGNLNLGASSTVTIDATGPTGTPGLDHDEIVISSGGVTLAGSGVVNGLSGYTPITDDFLDVIVGSVAPSGTWSVPGWTTSFVTNTVRLTAN